MNSSWYVCGIHESRVIFKILYCNYLSESMLLRSARIIKGPSHIGAFIETLICASMRMWFRLIRFSLGTLWVFACLRLLSLESVNVFCCSSDYFSISKTHWRIYFCKSTFQCVNRFELDSDWKLELYFQYWLAADMNSLESV